MSEDRASVELEQLLATAPAARTAWEALAPSHRREHIRYITEAVKPETRRRRAEATIERLRR